MTIAARTRYNFVAMSLHWIIAVLIIFMLVFGEDLMDHRQPDAFNASIHASIGMTILLLSILRLVWRFVTSAPALPATMKSWEVRLSKMTHALFYLMLIGLPLSGWLAFSKTLVEHPVLTGATFYGYFPIAQLAPGVDLPFGGVHSLGSNLMIGLVALHVLAALKHQFIDRDNLLRRMLP